MASLRCRRFMVPMKRALIVEFAKMSGAGNDFIVLDNRFYHFSAEELSAIARRMCPRRHGIGADGLLALEPAKQNGAAYRMVYINANGSEGTMCGNGACCLVRFARQAGFDADDVTLETASGLCRAHVKADAASPVRIYMQVPQHWRPSVHLHDTLPEAIDHVHYLWPGTEHIVCFTAGVADAPVSTWGPAIRHDPALAPAGANVNFVEVRRANTLTVRTFEKGVEAETLACGTGAVASATAAWLTGKVATTCIRVDMPGGTLTVGLDKDQVYLEGPAVSVYRGSFEANPADLSS